METDSKKNIADLCEAFLLLESKKEVLSFLKDLCTPQELSALSERWKVCRLLSTGKYSYREIHGLTGASLTTIGRVSRFLKDEPYNGYTQVLEKMKTP
jgi:TrpR-related protein YerC/YecD